MKRSRWLFAGVLLLALGASCLAGCGGSASSGTTSSGSSQAVTESDLGVPIYPGAEQVEASAMRQGQPPSGGPDGPQGSAPSRPPTTGTTPPQGSAPYGQDRPMGGPESMGTTFMTSDSYEKVIAWYKDQLSGKSGFKEGSMPTPPQGQPEGSAPASGMAQATVFTFNSDTATKMVMIRAATGDESGTYIVIGEAPSGNAPMQQSE